MRKLVLLKRSFVGFVAFLLIFSLTACGGKESGGSENKDNNTIEVVYRGPNEKAEIWLTEVKEKFEKSHKGVTVDINPIKTSEGNYPNKKILMLKTKKTAPDVIQEDSYQVNADSSADYLEPLTDKVKKWDGWDKFYDKVKMGVTAEDGNVYAIPYTTDTRGLWYNKVAFKKAGLPVPWHPENWEDIIKAAKALKGKVSVPIWINTGKGEATSMQTFEMLLYGTGDTLYDKDNSKWIAKSKGFLDSLKFINTIYKNHLGPSLSWALTGQAGKKVSEQLMPNLEVGIALDGNWRSGTWEKEGSHPSPKALKAYGFAAMPTENGQAPGKVSMSGGMTLAIPSKAKNKDLAWEFIKMATSKDNLRVGTELTPRKDIAKLPEYRSKSIREKATKLLKYTHYRPTYGGKYPSVSTCIQDAVEAVATNSLTPKEAMEKYEQDVKRTVGADKVTTK